MGRSSIQSLNRLLSDPGTAHRWEDFRQSKETDQRITEQINEALVASFATQPEREDLEAVAQGLYGLPKAVEKCAERPFLSDMTHAPIDSADPPKHISFRKITRALLPRSRPAVSPLNPDRRLPLAVWAGVAVLAGSVPLLRAYPPDPHFTVFGDVRDQYGILIPAGSASVVLYADAKEMAREALTDTPGKDFNYQIRVRIDMLRHNSASYSSRALSTGKIFTLRIESGGQVFYPIEMATSAAVGNAADRRRLDLTLGVDSDGDGLPDAWEESQLYQGGIRPGANGWDLSLIGRPGDFDHDGKSNFEEYLAGTYAADASSVMGLQIKEKLAAAVRLEFYAIYGKSYTLESSPDLHVWSDAAFSLTAPDAAVPGTPQSALLATNTGVMSVYSAADPAVTYYRLHIR